MRQFWTDAEDAVIRERYSQQSVAATAAALGRTRDSVKHRARKLGVAEPGAVAWTEEEYAFLAANYSTMPVAQIAAHLGKTPNAIHVQASLRGLKSRHRTGINSLVGGYFKVIDTPLKAYLLGLWAADGYVTARNQVCIALADKDRVLVELARDTIAPGARVGSYLTKEGNPMAIFRVQSAALAADLASHGIVPAKTLITTWPKALPRELEGSFACGYFDGDGSLYPEWLYRWSVVSGSPPFLAGLQDRAEAHTGVRPGGPYLDKRHNFAWSLVQTGEPVRALDAWLHRDVPGLARKRLASVTDS